MRLLNQGLTPVVTRMTDAYALPMHCLPHAPRTTIESIEEVTMSSEDILNRSALLTDLGYSHPEAQAEAVEILIIAKLTARHKIGILAAKRERCLRALLDHLCRRCKRCKATPSDGRRIVPVGRETECDICHGSPNALAVSQAAEACHRSGIFRIVIVGGSPSLHQEMSRLCPPSIHLRFVVGDDVHRKQEARSNQRWAELIVIIGGSILKHSVSTLYTLNVPTGTGYVLQVRRGGVEAVANEIREHAQRRRPQL